MAKRLTPASVLRIQERILKTIGRKAASRARPQIPSKTLRDALVFEIVSVVDGVARLHIPHYWAIYVHDGRGRSRPKNANVLIWFQNPKDDPRTNGGRNYPVRAGDIVRLTRAQYAAGLRENARRREEGLEPFMIVTKSSGPVSSTPFFTEGMAGMAGEIDDAVFRAFDKWVREHVRSEHSPAVITLR